jgi:hypothetical protein
MSLETSLEPFQKRSHTVELRSKMGMTMVINPIFVGIWGPYNNGDIP